MENYLVHLCARADWENAQRVGEYRSRSFDEEGFIHLSRLDQILAVANRFYPGMRNAKLLWIDPGKLKAEIRWESADGELFPHLYGPLNLDAVARASDFTPDEDGIFRAQPS